MKGILKYEKDGRTQFFGCESVAPLGLSELREVLHGKRSIHPACFRGFPCNEVGQPIGPKSILRGEFRYRKRVPFYGLVPGGVLPSVFLPHGVLLLDRNVIRACNVPLGHPDARRQSWWFETLNREENFLNPFMDAFEGRSRRTPDFDEFASLVQEASASMHARLPKASLIILGEVELRRLYEFRRSFDRRQGSESRFLVNAAPLLANRAAKSALDGKRSEVRKLASNCGLDGSSLVVIAALATLYESPSATGNLLKFKPGYSEADAYNAIADLRQLELFAGSLASPQSFTLLSNDASLALFWCGLRVEHVELGASTQISFSPHPDLFPRLPMEQLDSLLS